MLRLRGSEVLMLDGTIAMTEMISERDRRDHCLDMLLQKMCEHGDMVLGFDIEWPFPLSNDRRCQRLGKTFRLEIRNVVDLSELAADVLHQPRLRAFGVRSLAHEVLSVPFKARPSSIISVDRSRDHVTQEQIECASTDAYAAYKIGKKLLGV
ncbi:hypothetical protein CRYUN_Cryun08bG0033300 [Craigia yunnanensis]